MFTRFKPDTFTILLVGTLLLATFLPVSGLGAVVVANAVTVAIAWLFFLQGLRLAREAVVAGVTHWRLHLFILAVTFILFPILGLLLQAIIPSALTPPLWTGVIFLCVLPSTVQSSIAFTSIARGNVPAAICSATASNIGGIALTPLLVALLLRVNGQAGVSWSQVGNIVLELLVPFILGQILRPWLGDWAQRNKKILAITDRGSILLAVYSAFSAAVIEGIWHRLPVSGFVALILVDCLLLAIALTVTTVGSRLAGFDKADEAAIVFCGSKKTLVSGIPMANVLFAGPLAGIVVLPLMIFHQIQLLVCAALARRYYAQYEAAHPEAAPPMRA